MNHNLQKLIYLCYIKNELNKKRRRFSAITRGEIGQRINKHMHYSYQNKRMTKHISHVEAKAGYEQAQKDMKAMTKEMSSMRKECNVQFKWDSSGNIEYVKIGTDKYIKSKHFKTYHDNEVFEMEIFCQT